jgi:hypothetical protein
MRLRTCLSLLLAASLAAGGALAQTTLRVFSGGSNQRPDLMRKLFDQYERANAPASRSRSRPAARPPSCSASTCRRCSTPRIRRSTSS